MAASLSLAADWSEWLVIGAGTYRVVHMVCAHGKRQGARVCPGRQIAAPLAAITRWAAFSTRRPTPVPANLSKLATIARLGLRRVLPRPAAPPRARRPAGMANFSTHIAVGTVV